MTVHAVVAFNEHASSKTEPQSDENWDATSAVLCVIAPFLPRLYGLGHCAADSGWSEALTKEVSRALRSYAEEACRGCDRERQSPLGAPSACARFPPTSALPAAARPPPFLLVP